MLQRLTALWLAIIGALLVVFGTFVAADIAILGNPRPDLASGSVAAAVLGTVLLIVDAFVPVPATVVMVALGAALGLVPGVVLSTAGSMGALILGTWVGRRGRRPLAAFLGPDQDRLGPFVDRYGVLAVMVSRPVPLVAESVALMVGAAGMPWPRVLAAGAAGIFPVAVLFAFAGDQGSQASGVVVAGIVFSLACLSLALPRVCHRHRTRRARDSVCDAKEATARFRPPVGDEFECDDRS